MTAPVGVTLPEPIAVSPRLRSDCVNVHCPVALMVALSVPCSLSPAVQVPDQHPAKGEGADEIGRPSMSKPLPLPLPQPARASATKTHVSAESATQPILAPFL